MSIKSIREINEAQLEQYIPKNIIHWVCENIHHPIAGFESKKNVDGTYFSYDQQLTATKLQVLYVAHYWLTIGKPQKEVLFQLSYFCS